VFASESVGIVDGHFVKANTHTIMIFTRGTNRIRNHHREKPAFFAIPPGTKYPNNETSPKPRIIIIRVQIEIPSLIIIVPHQFPEALARRGKPAVALLASAQ
jgi:hypothetical protein